MKKPNLDDATHAQVVRYGCCGEVFSACIDGFQDAEFDREVRKYRKQGHTSEIIPIGSYKFGSCKCEKVDDTKKEKDPNQISMNL